MVDMGWHVCRHISGVPRISCGRQDAPLGSLLTRLGSARQQTMVEGANAQISGFWHKRGKTVSQSTAGEVSAFIPHLMAMVIFLLSFFS